MEIDHHAVSSHLPICRQDAPVAAESRRVLEQTLATRVRGFSYPRGRANQALAHLVQESGYDYACTTQPGELSSALDRFQLPRIPGPSTVSDLFFQLKHVAWNPVTRSALRLARSLETIRRGTGAAL
jgi:hypothetical protein